MNNTEQPIGVCLIVLNKAKDSLLLGKRLNSYKAGTFGMPGGRVYVGEPLIKSAERELFEETSLQSSSFEFIGTIRENQGDYDFIHFAYLCNDYEGDPIVTEPDKCEKWEWVGLKSLPENILPGHKLAIELYNAKISNKSTYLVDST